MHHVGSFVAEHGTLWLWLSTQLLQAAEHRGFARCGMQPLQLWHTGSRVCELSCCSTQAQLLHGLWVLSPQSRDQTRVPCITGGFLTPGPLGKSQKTSVLVESLAFMSVIYKSIFLNYESIYLCWFSQQQISYISEHFAEYLADFIFYSILISQPFPSLWRYSIISDQAADVNCLFPFPIN